MAPHFDPSSPAFNHSIVCSRTGLKVSFLDAGLPDGIPLFVILPSGNLRLFVLYIHNYAIDRGVRLIAVNRPGSGRTEECPLKDRIEVSCSMFESVLEHLKIDRVPLMSLSGGIYYALHLILTRPNLLTSPPLLLLLSPWVPVSVSGSALSYVPSFLIRSGPFILPNTIRLLNMSSSVASAAFSIVRKVEVTPETTDKNGLTPIQSGIDDPATKKKLEKLILAEGFAGAAQEHLLCLERRDGAEFGEAWFVEAFEKMGSLPEERRPQVEVWSAENDGMIPKKGRVWMDELGKRTLGDRYTSREVPGGHDDWMVEEKLGESFSVLRQRCPPLN